MKVCGIDPGKSGGLSFFNNDILVEVIPMPTYEVKKSNGKNKTMVNATEVGRFLKKHTPEVVYIENVAAMPSQGVSSMFSFGFSTGVLHGACGALEIPVTLVQPKAWQDALLGKKEKGETREKEETIQFCLKTWPNLSLLATPRSKKPHDGMSDACAIGYYGVLNKKA